MDASLRQPIAIDLFSGAGGLAEGLSAAGVHVAVAVEKHPHAALTCAYNHANTSVMVADVSKWGVTDDSEAMACLTSLVYKRTGKRKVDLVVGGPPCQGFSSAGLQNPNDPRNGLFIAFLRVVEYFRPRMFLFENVPGFAKLLDGAWVDAIVKRFTELGYQLHEIDPKSDSPADSIRLLDAAMYGVPQHRKRFLLVGWLPGKVANDFEWPKPTHGPRTGNEFVTAGEALSDLAFLRGGWECHSYPNAPETTFQRTRRKNSRVLFNHLATKHRPATVKMYRHIGQGCTIRDVPEDLRSGKQTMSRLRPDACSKVVLALPDDLVHYQRHRIPTVREMARLQGFDDDFVFLGKRTTSDANRRVDVPQYTQVGNAVPPLLAKAVGVAMMRALGLQPQDVRDLEERSRRHAWICGSSSYYGYSLSAEASGSLVLVNECGIAMPLPAWSTESAVATLDRPVDWTKLGKRIAVKQIR